MRVIVCLDDRNGMLFNRRRQSRDRRVVEDILRELGEKRLLVNGFSAPLFDHAGDRIRVEDDPLAAAGREDVCVVENQPLAPWAAAIERLTVYRWNRVYPADMRLDLALDRGWHLVAASDFPGFSHEKITKEIYER